MKFMRSARLPARRPAGRRSPLSASVAGRPGCDAARGGLRGRPGVPGAERSDAGGVQGGAGRRRDLAAGSARRCARPRRLVDAVRRSGPRSPGRAGHGLEPERRRCGGRLCAGAGAGARAARRAVSDARPRRQRTPHRRSRQRDHRERISGQPRRGLGAGPVGAPAQQRRRGERRRGREPGRPRRGATVGAGRAGDQLLLAARGRRRDRPASLDGRGLRALAADHPEPLRGRRDREDRRAAGPDPARQHARRPRRAAGSARASRACDRRAGRQGARRLRAGARAMAQQRCPRSRSACRRCCCSAAPTSPRPSATWPRPTRRSASSARPTSRACR